MDARRNATLLLEALQARGTAERAAGAKRYMRSQLAFTGASVPVVRRLAEAWLRNHRSLDRAALRAIAEALWSTGVFEARLMSTVMLQRRSEILRASDLVWLERLLRACRAWALMDNLAPYAVADVLARAPSLRRRILSRWSRDPDFWMRRAALLTMHRDLARGDGDWPLWTALAATHLEDQARWLDEAPSAEERFFIRKALGWALRDASRARPHDVVAFLAAHLDRVSGLTLREATRHLPAVQRKRLGL
ncbi:MAG: DNA alkylation repair protein [Candidatus Thermoplasmatota archaeon]|jgi:3-methyladenine DNA glycosylase AlkD